MIDNAGDVTARLQQAFDHHYLSGKKHSGKRAGASFKG